MFVYAVLGSMAEVMELTLLTYIRLAVEADLQLTSSEENLISIVTYVGIILEAWIWSAVSDSFGRKELWKGMGGGELGEASKIPNWVVELNKRQLPEGRLIFANTDESTHNVQPLINNTSDPPMIVEVSQVNELKESTSGIEKAEGKGTSDEGAQNEREGVTLEEDEIKDVTLDIDKTVAGKIQIDEAHHTFKKDDPVDRSSRTQVWLRLVPLRKNLITSMDESISQLSAALLTNMVENNSSPIDLVLFKHIFIIRDYPLDF
nr:organic cation/carnitine transporter 7 [Tanacetum cinerariifolium]